MCDRRYFDNDIMDMCCPEQPTCGKCYQLERVEANQYLMHYVFGAPPNKPAQIKKVEKVVEPERVGGVPLFEAKSMYELTLTTDKDDPYELRQYLDKVIKSKMYEVKRWEAVIELQKNGNPHIHAVLYTDRDFLDTSKLKAKKGIGFPYRATFEKVRKPTNYLKYMKKDFTDNITSNYCLKKGIPHFWGSHKD